MVFHPPVAIVAKAGDAGKYKVGLPAWNMVLRGFMSGAYIAMGAALATVCSTGIAYAALTPQQIAANAVPGAVQVVAGIPGGFASAGMVQLIMGAVFPVGLIITVLTGAELFTGDAMLAPMAAFIHKVSWMQVINLWIFVYIGNLIGSLVFAYIMAYGPFSTWGVDGAGATTVAVSAFGTRAIAIASAKVSYVGVAGMWSAFLKGIACNWLVNLAILLGICSDDMVGKFFGIWFPIMAFVSSGFEHSVANMYFIPAGIMTQGFITDPTKINAGLTWVTMWTNNIIIVTIGNIVGALFFVGIIY